MKSIPLLLLVMILSSTSLPAQGSALEMGGGAGSGLMYVFESSDSNSDASFSAPAAIYLDLSYRINVAGDGVKLRYQSTSTPVNGRAYRTRQALDGTVDTNAILLMYERLKTDSLFNWGYQIGGGHIVEELSPLDSTPDLRVTSRFFGINGGILGSLRLSSQLSLRGEAGFLWTDPINSLRSSDRWVTAGEDLGFLLNMGLSYSIGFGKS